VKITYLFCRPLLQFNSIERAIEGEIEGEIEGDIEGGIKGGMGKR
jgi:hypothetical protein